jgi:hypothetical protein
VQNGRRPAAPVQAADGLVACCCSVMSDRSRSCDIFMLARPACLTQQSP